MNRRLVVELLIGLGLIVAAGFAFIQTQTLTNTEATLEAARASGTQVGQAATEQADQGTAAAESAAATATQAAGNLEDSQQSATDSAQEAAQQLENEQATSTAAADESADTQAALEAEGTSSAEQAAGTATAAAESMNSAATQIAVADESQETLEARSTSSAEQAAGTATAAAESANIASTQAAQELADIEATATRAAETSAENISAVEVISAEQSTEIAVLNASNTDLQATIDANVAISGQGVREESATLADGYTRFRGEGYEIGLPASYEGIEMGGSTLSFFNLLEALELNSTAAFLQAQGDNLQFFAIDTELIGNVPGGTVSIIVEEPLTAELPLEDYLALAYNPLPEGYTIVVRDVVSVNGRPAGRVILNGQLIGGNVFVIQYVFEADGRYWLVTYSGPAESFDTLGGVIEESILTFRVQ